MSYSINLSIKVNVGNSNHEFLMMGDWNCTYNLSEMLYDKNVFGQKGIWKLDKKKSKSGIKILTKAINGLQKNPSKFRKLNPSNGWGDYDGLVKLLKTMKNTWVKYPKLKCSVT